MTHTITHTITLTDEEIGLLQEALDSYEYWEYRDALPHNSGFITIFDDQDFEARMGGDDREEVIEAWTAVKAARKLADKLHAAVVVEVPR